MIPEIPPVERFKQQLQAIFHNGALNSRALKVERHANVYTCGDDDKSVYFIDTGQVKLLMLSSEGKECILAIHTAGDLFGELSLSGSGGRMETATAMQASVVRQTSSSQFLAFLGRASLLEDFARYLVARIADQQQLIANLTTADSERRLGKTLLQLARTLGKKGPRNVRIDLKISHEELSEMVGTTRPRVTLFMQKFHNLGLIETTADHFLIIKDKKLNSYLNRIS
jgi:CRP-like cAMP-binding protein